MFICNNADNNGVLRVRFLKLNVYSSSKACTLALNQRVARVTMQSKERWIVCWSMLRHSVTIASQTIQRSFDCMVTRATRCINARGHAFEDEKTFNFRKRTRSTPLLSALLHINIFFHILINRPYLANLCTFQKCILRLKLRYLGEYCMKKHIRHIKF